MTEVMGNVLEKPGTVRHVGDEIQEIHQDGNAQTCAEAAAAGKGGYTEADGGDLHLYQKVCQMQQVQFFPVNLFTDDDGGSHG